MNASPQRTLIWQRFTNVFSLEHTTGKKEHFFDPQRVTLLGKDSICMVNLLETPQVIIFFFNYMIDLLRLFQKKSFVLSSEHENQNVASIGTLLDQFMLSCK